jgi:hypothetical protein
MNKNLKSSFAFVVENIIVEDNVITVTVDRSRLLMLLFMLLSKSILIAFGISFIEVKFMLLWLVLHRAIIFILLT